MTTLDGDRAALTPPLGRLAAVLGLVAAAVHVLLLDTSSLGSLAMVGMALVCLPCSWHLWRRPTPSVWGTTATVDAAMLVLHVQMLVAVTHSAHLPTAAPHGLMWSGLAVVTCQLVVAGAAALRRWENSVTPRSQREHPFTETEEIE